MKGLSRRNGWGAYDVRDSDPGRARFFVELRMTDRGKMLSRIRGAWLLRSVLRDPPSCGGQAGRAGTAESSRSNGRARRPAPTGHFRLGGFEAVVEGDRKSVV